MAALLASAPQLTPIINAHSDWSHGAISGWPQTWAAWVEEGVRHLEAERQACETALWEGA